MNRGIIACCWWMADRKVPEECFLTRWQSAGTEQKNIKGEKNIENAAEENGETTDKEKIKELVKKKREMQEELDELKENTAKGKAVCVLVFFVLIGLIMGAFVGMVKLDIGGVASETLAPAIADVPVLRNILPVEMQKKNTSELAAILSKMSVANAEILTEKMQQ